MRSPVGLVGLEQLRLELVMSWERTMHRRSVITGLLSVCATLSIGNRRAAAWALITKDEFLNESRAAPVENAPLLAQPGAPVIEVLEPDPTRPIKSPATIRISFRPMAGATINPASFRAKYGWLGIDITDRLVGHAQVDASGLSASNAEIPAGQYKITLQIADNLGRVGTRAFEFSVS
jgi:hypothetical protein